jgi:flavin-dependent dehydrogenase
VVEGLPLPGYGWMFSTGSAVANVGFGCDVRAYKAQKRQLKDLLETYKDFLPYPLVFDDETRKSHVLPLASQMPPLAYPAVKAALIGDAASMINPLSGEGIFYGMEAGLRLGQHLSTARKTGHDWARALDRYEREFRRSFTRHFRGNYYLRRSLEKPVLLERMIGACARNTELGCDYVEYMMGNESSVGGRSLFRLALGTIFA